MSPRLGKGLGLGYGPKCWIFVIKNLGFLDMDPTLDMGVGTWHVYVTREILHNLIHFTFSKKVSATNK